MDGNRLEALHDHYRDTCSVVSGYRQTRDWCFYAIVLLVAVTWFDVVAPDDFARVTAEALKNRLQLTNVPNLTYLQGVLWFTLLGLTLRYCQASLHVEREYQYLKRLEHVLAQEVHSEFGREGVHYRRHRTPFTKWAHHIYATAFPLLLTAIVLAWTGVQLRRAWPWSFAAAFELLISAGIVVTLILYMRSHRLINAKKTPES